MKGVTSLEKKAAAILLAIRPTASLEARYFSGRHRPANADLDASSLLRAWAFAGPRVPAPTLSED